MAFRTRHKTKSGKFVYAKRDSKGRFTDIQNIGRAIAQDKRRKAKNRTKKPRQGFKGDYNGKRKKPRRRKSTTQEVMPRVFKQKPTKRKTKQRTLSPFEKMFK